MLTTCPWLVYVTLGLIAMRRLDHGIFGATETGLEDLVCACGPSMLRETRIPVVPT
jgi:hypothetical protein